MPAQTATASQPETCQPSVEHIRGRYPYVPTCTCGWKWRGYVAEHAAQTMADAHGRGEV